MVDVAISVTRFLAALFLVLLNGFFVASEFAFVRVRSTTVEQLVEEGWTGTDTLQEVMDTLDDYLATTQLEVTPASPETFALWQEVVLTALPCQSFLFLSSAD